MSQDVLEHRYRRILHAYPPAWRARRADEMVTTYLETSPDTKRRLTFRDVYDVLAAAARLRLRMSADAGLAAGTRLAAELALLTASGLAVFWFCRIELAPTPDWFAIFDDARVFSPVQSLGVFMWIAWMAVTLASVVLSGRWLRRVVLGAMVVSVLVVPAAALLPYYRMPLFLLVPQLALGALVLLLGERRNVPVRLAPVAVMVAVAIPSLLRRPWDTPDMYTGQATDAMMSQIGWLLLFAGLLCAFGLGLRRPAGMWALLVLTPVAMTLAYTSLHDQYIGSHLGDFVWNLFGGGIVTDLITVGLIVLFGVVLFAAAVGLQNRYQHSTPSTGAKT